MRDDHDIEARLRAYRPVSPAATLRTRVLDAAGRESRHPTRPAWTLWVAAAAAALLVGGGVAIRSVTRALDARLRVVEPATVARTDEDQMVRLYGDTPDVRAWARAVLVPKASDVRDAGRPRLLVGERP